MKKKIINLSFILLISFVFIDIVGAQTYNNYESATVSCGNGYVTDIPYLLPKVISILYTAIQIAVPIVLVIVGSLDLMKCITSGKDDEIKKGQKKFIKRLIVAVLIFFVFVLVKFLISLVADSQNTKVIKCAECFIRNDCD